MNGELYTGDEFRRVLSEYAKMPADEFSQPVTAGSEGGGMLIRPDENASFPAVMQLLELLKECKVTAYSVVSTHQKDPNTRTELILPIYSAKLEVTHYPIEPAPPKDSALSPEQRIQEITEKMGGLPRK